MDKLRGHFAEYDTLQALSGEEAETICEMRLSEENKYCVTTKTSGTVTYDSLNDAIRVFIRLLAIMKKMKDIHISSINYGKGSGKHTVYNVPLSGGKLHVNKICKYISHLGSKEPHYFDTNTIAHMIKSKSSLCLDCIDSNEEINYLCDLWKEINHLVENDMKRLTNQ